MLVNRESIFILSAKNTILGAAHPFPELHKKSFIQKINSHIKIY